MDLAQNLKKAREASIFLAATGGDVKNKALKAIAAALKAETPVILEANKKDLAAAEADKLAMPLLKRLKFDQPKIEGVCQGIEDLIRFEDPVGQTLSARELDEGLDLYQVSCPIGVIGVIFESRPDALVQISTLCLKSGNAVLLKGGSEALHTNRILADIINKASLEAGLPEGWITLLETREDVKAMLSYDKYIDLIIPRGSNEFVQFIMSNTNIPVMGHADGICHLYVDEGADVDMAVNVTIDSKTQYVAVCNALETLLVHEAIAPSFLPALAERMADVELRGCPESRALVPRMKEAVEEDWKTEYLDYILSVKVVSSLEEAVDHINQYGSGHTDSIVTADPRKAADFMNLVDGANVFWNASTRFADGFRYGLGAEVGISTNKIHARGPVGIEGLLIYKWKLLGGGHVVNSYGSGGRSFTHKTINKPFKL